MTKPVSKSIRSPVDKIKPFLEKLSGKDLLKLKATIDEILKKKFNEELGRRVNKRIPINLPAACVLEREKEFFTMEHRITLLNISANGLCFKTKSPMYVEDIMEIFFQLPKTGTRKDIFCKALRVKEKTTHSGTEYEVGTQSVSPMEVRKYRDMLLKRGA